MSPVQNLLKAHGLKYNPASYHWRDLPVLNLLVPMIPTDNTDYKTSEKEKIIPTIAAVAIPK